MRRLAEPFTESSHELLPAQTISYHEANRRRIVLKNTRDPRGFTG